MYSDPQNCPTLFENQVKNGIIFFPSRPKLAKFEIVVEYVVFNNNTKLWVKIYFSCQVDNFLI